MKNGWRVDEKRGWRADGERRGARMESGWRADGWRADGHPWIAVRDQWVAENLKACFAPPPPLEKAFEFCTERFYFGCWCIFTNRTIIPAVCFVNLRLSKPLFPLCVLPTRPLFPLRVLPRKPLLNAIQPKISECYII